MRIGLRVGIKLRREGLRDLEVARVEAALEVGDAGCGGFAQQVPRAARGPRVRVVVTLRVRVR